MVRLGDTFRYDTTKTLQPVSLPLDSPARFIGVNLISLKALEVNLIAPAVKHLRQSVPHPNQPARGDGEPQLNVPTI